MKREKQTPAKQLGLDGFAEDQIRVPWPSPRYLFEALEDVTPEAVNRAADAWRLKPRERRVLKVMYLEQLLTAESIARRLGLSVETVETYIKAIYSAAPDVHSRGDLLIALFKFENPAPVAVPNPQPVRNVS